MTDHSSAFIADLEILCARGIAVDLAAYFWAKSVQSEVLFPTLSKLYLHNSKELERYALGEDEHPTSTDGYFVWEWDDAAEGEPITCTSENFYGFPGAPKGRGATKAEAQNHFLSVIEPAYYD